MKLLLSSDIHCDLEAAEALVAQAHSVDAFVCAGDLGVMRRGLQGTVDVLAEIDRFRAALAEHFITFDPGDVDEKLLLDRAVAAAREGRDWLEVAPHSFGGRRDDPTPPRVSVREVLEIAGDIDGQIYMRDFKLIDQPDMIVSLVPELPGGVPGLSSGVERELQHAWEHTKEVYVVWKPKKNPSPFITETATKIFPTVDDALGHFEAKGMFAQRDLFGH